MNLNRRLVSRASALARGESGASMVEFAIVLPILFLFVFGIIDFGRALFQYNNLTNAARQGARNAATRFPSPCAEIDEVKEYTGTRIAEFNGNPAANPEAYVSVECSFTGGGNPQSVTVKIENYPFQAITPLPFLQDLTLGSDAIPISAMVRFEGALPSAP